MVWYLRKEEKKLYNVSHEIGENEENKRNLTVTRVSDGTPPVLSLGLESPMTEDL